MRRTPAVSVTVLLCWGEIIALGNILGQPDPGLFDLSRPTYFITGVYLRDEQSMPPLAGWDNQVKFRININYRLIGSETSRHGLYFGYTQLSFWNIYDRGAPFLDNNYSPELTAFFDALVLPRDRWYVPSASLALKHESNGQSGDIDRSWDRVVLTTELGHPSRALVYGHLTPRDAPAGGTGSL